MRQRFDKMRCKKEAQDSSDELCTLGGIFDLKYSHQISALSNNQIMLIIVSMINTKTIATESIVDS